MSIRSYVAVRCDSLTELLNAETAGAAPGHEVVVYVLQGTRLVPYSWNPAQNTWIRAGYVTSLDSNSGVAMSSGGSLVSSVSVIEKDLGFPPRYSGSFQIPGSGLTPGNVIRIEQAPGPYTGKGNRADEAEMDSVSVSAYVLDANTVQCYWHASGPVSGNFRFSYR